MDPIDPWLDPIEVRRLADILIRPNREPLVGVSEAGFDAGFVGYSSDQDAPSLVPQPPPISQSGELPPPPAAATPTLEIVTTAQGPFLERIKLFADWMHHQFSATEIFILDREGVVVFDESHHGRLHFLARSLALAPRRQGPENVHIKIGAEATLEVIPVDTSHGNLILGAVVPNALPMQSVTMVMGALYQMTTQPQG